MHDCRDLVSAVSCAAPGAGRSVSGETRPDVGVAGSLGRGTHCAPSYLRQGVRALGWIQLGRVRLGYELWRLFNGFPPALPSEPTLGDTAGKAGGKGSAK